MIIIESIFKNVRLFFYSKRNDSWILQTCSLRMWGNSV